MSDTRGPFTTEQILLRGLIRQARLDAGLRQQDLADALNVPQSWISKVESGERSLDILELRRVCRAIGVPFLTFVASLDEALERRAD